MSKKIFINQNKKYPLSGPLPLRMTNDVLFHHLLQDTRNTTILKNIISAYLDIPIENIKSATVENPISLGDDITSKEMVLDVKTLLNDDKFINVKATHHIGFIDFNLFEDVTQFFSNYKLRENTTGHLFSSKFSISVVNLTKIENATEEDKLNHRDLWARFFKSTSWEEINMLAQQDSAIDEAALKMYHLTEDQKLRDQCFAREDRIRCEKDRDHYFNTEIQKRDDIIAQKDATIADKDATIAEQAAIISKLMVAK